MEIRANYILIGLFTLLALFGILGTVLWISNSAGDEVTDEYIINFQDSVSGLSIGNSVLFSGIKVGQVQNVKISEAVPGAVKVLISVRGDTPVREDSEARLEMVGLTGAVAVSISGGTAGSPLMDIPVGVQGTIKSRPSPLSAVMEKAPDTVAMMNAVLSNVNDLTKTENREAISTALISLADLSLSLAEEKDTIVSILRDTQVSAREFKNLVASASSLVKDLEGAMDHLGPEISATTSETLPQLRVLITESRLLVQTFSRIGQKLDSDPGRFLFGNPIKEYQP